MSETWQIVALVAGALGALGGLGGLAGLLLYRKTGRKLDADAVSVLTNAAVAMVNPLSERVNVLSADVAQLHAHVSERQHLAAEHSGWDYIAEQKAAEAGIVLPPRPPLTPATPLLSQHELEQRINARDGRRDDDDKD